MTPEGWAILFQTRNRHLLKITVFENEKLDSAVKVNHTFNLKRCSVTDVKFIFVRIKITSNRN